MSLVVFYPRHDSTVEGGGRRDDVSHREDKTEEQNNKDESRDKNSSKKKGKGKKGKRGKGRGRKSNRETSERDKRVMKEFVDSLKGRRRLMVSGKGILLHLFIPVPLSFSLYLFAYIPSFFS